MLGCVVMSMSTCVFICVFYAVWIETLFTYYPANFDIPGPFFLKTLGFLVILKETVEVMLKGRKEGHLSIFLFSTPLLPGNFASCNT